MRVSILQAAVLSGVILATGTGQAQFLGKDLTERFSGKDLKDLGRKFQDRVRGASPTQTGDVRGGRQIGPPSTNQNRAIVIDATLPPDVTPGPLTTSLPLSPPPSPIPGTPFTPPPPGETLPRIPYDPSIGGDDPSRPTFPTSPWAGSPTPISEKWVKNKFLAVLKPGLSEGRARALSQRYQHLLQEKDIFSLAPLMNQFVVVFVADSEDKINVAMPMVEGEPDVFRVERSFLWWTLASSSEEAGPLSYGPQKIRAKEAQQLFTGREIRTGVIDTNVDERSIDFKKTKFEKRSVTDQCSQAPHGTAVTKNIKDIAPGAEILAICAFWPDPNNPQRGQSDSDTLAKAMTEAVARGVDLINLSLGWRGDRDKDRNIIIDAMREALKLGIPIVAAGGTKEPGGEFHPLAVEGTLVFTATDENDHLYQYATLDGVRFAAPGVRILTSAPGNKFQNLSGTSMAAGFGTGVIALMLEALRKFPRADRMLAVTNYLQGHSPVLDAKGQPLPSGLQVVDALSSLQPLLTITASRY